LSLGFVFFRPFGGAAYGDGREDDDEGYEDSVEELSGQRDPALPKILSKRFWMAVFQARAATSPSAVVMSWENLSRTSPVNALSFPTAVVSVCFRGAVRGAVQTVLGVGA
jgi:hypothetical protein